jgi:hypothetical protein
VADQRAGYSDLELEIPQLVDTRNLLNASVARLPRQGVKAGAVAFAADGRKAGEGAGDGTGVPVYADPATDGSIVWRVYRDDSEVSA